MTGERSGRRRFDARLSRIGATETFRTQLDLRVDPAASGLPFALPLEPNTWLGSDGREILWLGPDEWLVLANPDSREPRQQIAELEVAFAGVHHSVVDVSAGRSVFVLESDDRHELLSKGCSLDLHPRSWRDGMCAQTLLARVPVVLQERAKDTGILVRPSFAGYLVDWLLDAAGVRA